jgi:hypothetical protein
LCPAAAFRGGGPQPSTRTSHGQHLASSDGYLTLALPAADFSAAATDAGSAKAITASPSVLIVSGRVAAKGVDDVLDTADLINGGRGICTARVALDRGIEGLQDLARLCTRGIEEPAVNRETIRAHVFETAERLEADLGPEQFAYDAAAKTRSRPPPEPGPPVTVGRDGGYIRGRERRPGGTGCFEVIAGKSIPQEGPAKLFAGVGRIDTKPKRRLHEVLQSQGVLPRQQVIFISDGGDTVRELPAFLHPHSERILDWFHMAMRIEQLMQTARGVRGAADDELTKEAMLKELERTKW